MRANHIVISNERRPTILIKKNLRGKNGFDLITIIQGLNIDALMKLQELILYHCLELLYYILYEIYIPQNHEPNQAMFEYFSNGTFNYDILLITHAYQYRTSFSQLINAWNNKLL